MNGKRRMEWFSFGGCRDPTWKLKRIQSAPRDRWRIRAEPSSMPRFLHRHFNVDVRTKKTAWLRLRVRSPLGGGLSPFTLWLWLRRFTPVQWMAIRAVEWRTWGGFWASSSGSRSRPTVRHPGIVVQPCGRVQRLWGIRISELNKECFG